MASLLGEEKRQAAQHGQENGGYIKDLQRQLSLEQHHLHFSSIDLAREVVH